MNAEILNTTYVNGKRITEQRITYTYSDDLFTLANCQRQYENILNYISENPDKAQSYETERVRLLAEVNKWQDIVDCYGEEAE